jgi:hypothetical protein
MVLEDPDGRRGAVVQGVGSLLRDREKVFKSECVCVGWGGVGWGGGVGHHGGGRGFMGWVIWGLCTAKSGGWGGYVLLDRFVVG